MPSSLESVGAGHPADKLGSPTRSGAASAASNASTPPIAAQVDGKKPQPQPQPQPQSVATGTTGDTFTK